MSDGTLFKPEKDFTKDVDQQIPEAEALAKTNVQGAIDKLLVLEKQARQASDLPSTSRLLVGIVTICKNAREWELLNEQVIALSKKHGQLKQAITKMVQDGNGGKDNKEAEEKEKKRSPDDPPVEKPEDVTDLKLLYYEQQIILANHESKYLDVCKHYRQVLDTESVEENSEQLRAVLQRVIYYVILSPFDNEQSDLLHRIQADTRNSLVPVEARLVKLFTINELMRWPMVAEQFGPHLCSTDVFSAKTNHTADDQAYQRWQDLRKRVIEHNVRVIAKYYTRIEMGRLTQLLDLDEEETEKYISDLVTSKTIYAKIDRPARLVNFAKPRDADDVLNEWSSNMKSLLGLLERIDHLITKEEMMARILPSKAGRSKAR
ncbi:26S proteasome non-ATPase regulatory subunit 12 [Trichophyton equinum CBS 127.97]|uniref:26S proteasome non-ATPase regulatory subunit 12 n=1 Tax=Trichophyton equinum (strain ATCC MYA-4606 / CBS 127.97) TaxID=559882 RepID=F2Q424_TRIEC|nr:26S proteasome non-ATPase regulatory subunit 12 [Trichophyton equinum CBS 127.97]